MNSPIEMKVGASALMQMLKYGAVDLTSLELFIVWSSISGFHHMTVPMKI